jgi:hypothetical protein
MMSEDVKKRNDKIEETYEFTQLVEKMKGKSGSHILEIFDEKPLLEVLCELLQDITTSSDDKEYEDRMIVEYSLSIIVVLLMAKKENFEFFISKNVCAETLMKGLFFKMNLNIRKYFMHTIFLLCREALERNELHEEMPDRLLSLLLNNIPSSVDLASKLENEKKDCTQYYEILGKLLEDLYSNTRDQPKPKGKANISPR